MIASYTGQHERAREEGGRGVFDGGEWSTVESRLAAGYPNPRIEKLGDEDGGDSGERASRIGKDRGRGEGGQGGQGIGEGAGGGEGESCAGTLLSLDDSYHGFHREDPDDEISVESKSLADLSLRSKEAFQTILDRSRREQKKEEVYSGASYPYTLFQDDIDANRQRGGGRGASEGDGGGKGGGGGGGAGGAGGGAISCDSSVQGDGVDSGRLGGKSSVWDGEDDDYLSLSPNNSAPHAHSRFQESSSPYTYAHGQQTKAHPRKNLLDLTGGLRPLSNPYPRPGLSGGSQGHERLTPLKFPQGLPVDFSQSQSNPSLLSARSSVHTQHTQHTPHTQHTQRTQHTQPTARSQSIGRNTYSGSGSALDGLLTLIPSPSNLKKNKKGKLSKQPIMRPSLNPTVKISSSSIADLKREFFG